MKLRLLASVCTILSLLVLAAAPASAQICIANSPDRASLSSVSASTGGVDLPHDMGLHTVGVRHLTGPGGFFGLGQSEYTVQYGALTGHPNGDDYDAYAYRAGGRWLFALPLPADLPGPGALGACLTLGTRFSGYGYRMKMEAVDASTDGDIAAWHFSMALPITVDVGYRIPLNESMAVVPWVAPGISPYWGGLIHESTVDNEEGALGTGTDFFTTMGAVLNYEIFRAGITLQTGRMEYGSPRFGLEAGIRW